MYPQPRNMAFTGSPTFCLFSVHGAVYPMVYSISMVDLLLVGYQKLLHVLVSWETIQNFMVQRRGKGNRCSLSAGRKDSELGTESVGGGRTVKERRDWRYP